MIIPHEPTLDKLQNELTGGSIIQRAKDIMSGVRKDKFPPQERKWIEENGSKIIEKITLFRRPVNSAVDKVFDMLMLGKWSSMKSRYGFDVFFHLGMVCEYDNGKSVLIDKTGTLNIKESGIPSDAETLELPIRTRFSFNHMFNGAVRIMGEDRFYRYDAFKSNCQMFVMSLLQAVGMASREAKEFVYQDIEELVKEIPKYAQKLSNVVTDIAGVADVASRGAGFIMNARGNQSHLYYQDYRKINTYLPPHQQRKPLKLK